MNEPHFNAKLARQITVMHEQLDNAANSLELAFAAADASQAITISNKPFRAEHAYLIDDISTLKAGISEILQHEPGEARREYVTALAGQLETIQRTVFASQAEFQPGARDSDSNADPERPQAGSHLRTAQNILGNVRSKLNELKQAKTSRTPS